jgi:hypothetical protein
VTGLRLWLIKPNAVNYAERYLLRYLIANVSYFLFWILGIRPTTQVAFAEMVWYHVVGPVASAALVEQRSGPRIYEAKDANTARTIESAHRTALANGLVGIREKTPSPSLAEFFKNDFVPCVETKHAAKPETAEYYTDGASMVMQMRAGSQPPRQDQRSARTALRCIRARFAMPIRRQPA